MHIENKPNCTGCGACYNICPKNAIEIQSDSEGFYKPVINKEKCVNCGLCEKICPLDKYKSNNFKEPKVFAFMNSDEIRAKSTSGGAFFAFANYVLENKGVVYGVIWNEDINAVHSRATNSDETEKMHGSKYVQSNTQDTFKQAKDDLENGKQVLFSGTPCQIAGLKSYLQKDYDNLFTIDIICHGVASPLVLEMYKKEFLKNKRNEKILNINFRSKIYGWINDKYINIVTNKNSYIYSKNQDNYIKAFLPNFSLNSSCFSCQFNRVPRMADISIGDFWGVDEYDKSMNDKKGLSVVLINSQKAKEIFEKIQYFKKEIPLEFVIKHNPNIITPSNVPQNRDKFFEDIKKGKSLKYCVKKYIKDNVPFYIKMYLLLPQFAKDFIKYKILKREKC